MSIITSTKSVVSYLEGSPLASGTTSLFDSPSDAGLTVLAQRVTLAKSASDPATVDGTILLPANAQVLDWLIDVTTAWDSGTSAGLTIGTASLGTQFVASLDVKSIGRKAPTYTAAQLALMQDIGSTNLTAYVSVAQVGATTAGAATVTVRYVQTAASGTN